MMNDNLAAATPPEFDGTVAIRRDGSTPQFEDVSPGMAPLENGEKIGPYEIREHVGDGGMASVYKAWHTNLHRFEALKIPRHQHTYGPEAAFLRRLLAEARTSARLHHPHIVAIHNVSEADAPLQYFAMDFVGGCDLARLLESRGRLPVGEALPILNQIASALDYAHSQNVVHRDVKPGNILLTNSGVLSAGESENPGGDWFAKVVDFGISRAGEDTGGTRMTRSGMIVGTPEYMSPEQSGSGEPVTHRTDIYSLGIVAYEMLCGTPPFTAGDGVSRISILMKHVGDAPPAPTDFLPKLPPAAADVISKVLSKKPEDRFGSCGEFVKELSAALATSDYAAQDQAGAVVASNIARPQTALMSGALPTLIGEMPAAPPARLASRTTTLLAGLGGLLAGAAIVFGWFGNGNQRVVQKPVTPAAIIQPQKVSVEAAVGNVPVTNVPVVKVNSAKVPLALRIVNLQRSEIVPFARRTQPSPALLRGQKRIAQKGANGKRELKIAVSYRGDKEVGRRIVENRIAQKPVDEITLSGTKAPAVTATVTATVRAVKAAPRVVRRAPRVTRAAAPRPRAKPRPVRRASRPAQVRQAPRKRIARAATKRKPLEKRGQSAPRRPRFSGGDAPLPP